MPTINFKGKGVVWNHHLSVPYQILEKDKNLSVKGKNADDNLIIEADNLIALKSLLPKYQGKIKCIYIDPPYNTGNEGWIYNDNVNNPLIKSWIGKSVGADDLTRHEKWLCMMTPRLKLLYELLSDDGAMFISIDDIEIHHLKMLLAEIFREDNIETMIWHKVDDDSGRMKITHRFRNEHEYIVVAYKDKNKVFFKKYKADRNYKNDYDNPDNDKRGPYKQGIISNTEENSNKNSQNYYAIILPSGRKITRQWRIAKQEFDELLADKRIYFGKKGDSIPSLKVFINEQKDATPISILDNLGTAKSAGKELSELFGTNQIFNYPKPVNLIKHLIRIATEKQAIILDCFAGSGTTAQSVLELNEQDGIDRKFILVQIPEEIKKNTPAYEAGFRYVHEITQERVKKVIKKNELDTGFSYMKLGPAIDADALLSGTLPTYREFAKYVYYLATGKIIENEKSIDEKSYFVGKNKNEAIYLIYQKDKDKLKNMAINLDWAEEVNKKDKGRKIVYAPACFLDEEYLEKFNMQFVSVPYNLFEKK